MREKQPDESWIGTDGIVARRDGRVAIVLLSSNSYAYAYMTDGFLVALDPENPGGIVTSEIGAPVFTWTADLATRQETFTASFVRDSQHGKVQLHIGSLLQLMTSRATNKEYDEKTQVVSFNTRKGNVKVQMRSSPKGAASGIPVRKLIVDQPDGQSYLEIGSNPDPGLDFFSISKEVVAGLGVPTRRLRPGENIDKIMFTKELGKVEIAVATKLMSAFPKLPPRDGPSTKASGLNGPHVGEASR